MNKTKLTKIVLFSVAAAVFVTLLILMQLSVVGFKKEEIGGRSFFDAMLIYYNRSYFYSTLAIMNADMIKRYFLFHIADNIFVLSYFILMVGLMSAVLPAKLKFLYAVPALTALADAAENLSIDILLFLFPKQYAYADFVGVLSCIKWYSGAVWAAIVLVLGTYKLYKYIRTLKRLRSS